MVSKLSNISSDIFIKLVFTSSSIISIYRSSFISSWCCCFFLNELYFIVFPRIMSNRVSKKKGRRKTGLSPQVKENFNNRSKAVLLLWIVFVSYATCWFVLHCRV